MKTKDVSDARIKIIGRLTADLTDKLNYSKALLIWTIWDGLNGILNSERMNFISIHLNGIKHKQYC